MSHFQVVSFFLHNSTHPTPPPTLPTCNKVLGVDLNCCVNLSICPSVCVFRLCPDENDLMNRSAACIQTLCGGASPWSRVSCSIPSHMFSWKQFCILSLPQKNKGGEIWGRCWYSHFYFVPTPVVFFRRQPPLCCFSLGTKVMCVRVCVCVCLCLCLCLCERDREWEREKQVLTTFTIHFVLIWKWTDSCVLWVWCLSWC